MKCGVPLPPDPFHRGAVPAPPAAGLNFRLRTRRRSAPRDRFVSPPRPAPLRLVAGPWTPAFSSPPLGGTGSLVASAARQISLSRSRPDKLFSSPASLMPRRPGHRDRDVMLSRRGEKLRISGCGGCAARYTIGDESASQPFGRRSDHRAAVVRIVRASSSSTSSAPARRFRPGGRAARAARAVPGNAPLPADGRRRRPHPRSPCWGSYPPIYGDMDLARAARRWRGGRGKSSTPGQASTGGERHRNPPFHPVTAPSE